MSRQDSGRLQRELQDEMTDEIHKMVGVLKDNTLELHRILTKDNQVLERSENVIQANLRKTERETRRMRDHMSKSRGTTWTTCAILAITSFLFFFVYAVIRQFPVRMSQ